MGQRVCSVEGLTHGYSGRMLFKDVDLEIEKGDRVAIIGPNGAGACVGGRRMVMVGGLCETI